MRFWPSVLGVLLAGPVAAQDVQMSCFGEGPSWTLEIDAEAARFEFIGVQEMTIPQSTRAEGRAWPLAMTLISEDYSGTAIVVLHEKGCTLNDEAFYPNEVQVLTQRTDEPILLSGCCSPIITLP